MTMSCFCVILFLTEKEVKMEKYEETFTFRISRKNKDTLKREARALGKHTGEHVRDFLIRPFEACPRFDGCSVNVCPLDPLQNDKNRLQNEPKCTMRKSVRKRIGKKHSKALPLKGLTKREHSGMKNWHDKTPAEQKRITEQGIKSLKALKKGINERGQ